MFTRNLFVLTVLLVLGGCATAPAPTSSHTTASGALPAVAGSIPGVASSEMSAPEAEAMPAPGEATPAPAATSAPRLVPASTFEPDQAEVAAADANARPEPKPAAISPRAATTSLPPSSAVSAAPVQIKPPTSNATAKSSPATGGTHLDRNKPPEPAAEQHAPTVVATPPKSGKTTVRGRVVLSVASGLTRSQADLSNTLVYFVPRSLKARPRPGHYTVYTNHHDFDPGAMAVPLGSTIRFVNLDSVDHNVFSVTPGNKFNLGYQSHGEIASHTFSHSGLVLIGCNVHHSMELDILVVPSPYATHVNAEGRFTMDHVPRGPGTLYAWNPRSRMARQAISLPQDAPAQLRLVLTRTPVRTVLNAGGEP